MNIDVDEITTSNYRKMLKKNGICRECKKQDAYTIGGRTLCYECSEKQRLYKQEKRKLPEYRERMLYSSRKRRARLIDEHKCPQCGNSLANNYKYKWCTKCLAKARVSRKSARERKTGGESSLRGQNGICWQCNKLPVIFGKKLCNECYKQKVKVATQNLKNVDMENHPWKSKLKAKKE